MIPLDPASASRPRAIFFGHLTNEPRSAQNRASGLISDKPPCSAMAGAGRCPGRVLADGRRIVFKSVLARPPGHGRDSTQRRRKLSAHDAKLIAGSGGGTPPASPGQSPDGSGRSPACQEPPQKKERPEGRSLESRRRFVIRTCRRWSCPRAGPRVPGFPCSRS